MLHCLSKPKGVGTSTETRVSAELEPTETNILNDLKCQSHGLRSLSIILISNVLPG